MKIVKGVEKKENEKNVSRKLVFEWFQNFRNFDLIVIKALLQSLVEVLTVT